MTVDPTQNLIIGAGSGQSRMGARLADLERRLATQEQGRPYQLPTVTSWPANPVRGQSVAFAINPSNGIVWQFRYNPDEATYPWEFVGGPPIIATASEGGDATQGSSYTDLTGGGVTVGPSISLPLAGDYIINHTADLSVQYANTWGLIAVGGAGLTANDADAAGFGNGSPSPALILFGSTHLRIRKNGLTTASALTLKYRTAGGGLGPVSFSNRALEVIPIRCR